jgi:hypothetical protein
MQEQHTPAVPSGGIQPCREEKGEMQVKDVGDDVGDSHWPEMALHQPLPKPK